MYPRTSDTSLSGAGAPPGPSQSPALYPGLPEGTVVETNALVSGDAVAPITAGPLPPEVCEMVHTTVTNQETLVEAGFTGDLDLALQAFLNEPLVTVQRDTADAMFGDLIELERDYLNAYDLETGDVLN